ncbi:MAG: DUF975 family protein [Roseburia sp.]|nr:DUF975 family protein [Roseburia sp.]
MIMYQKSSDLKDSAKGHLTGRYYNTVMTCLLSSTLMLFISQSAVTLTTSLENTIYRLTGASQELPAVSVLSYVLLLLASILCNIFYAGLALFFLNIACNRSATVFDLFYGFQQQLGKTFLISGALTLLRTVCMLPVDIGLYLYAQNRTIPGNLLRYLAGALLLGMLIYIPVSLALSQSFYLMLDFPDYGALDTMKLSMRIMKGHKKRLFYIEVSFLPLIFLSALTLGIGSLWLTPYRNTTYALFFLDIMKPEQQTHSSTSNIRS